MEPRTQPPSNAPADDRPGLSVAIVCKDSARTIGATLDAVASIADEIVALDSGSTDETVALLERAGAVVHRVRWEGFVKTKQRALEACSCAWVLCLDSDEAPDERLARAVRELVDRQSTVSAARVNRKVIYRGRLLDHAWQPEPRLRLVRRSMVETGEAAWGGLDPHDVLGVNADGAVVVDLPGTLVHDSFERFSDHLVTQARHGRRMAESLAASGVRGSLFRALTSPAGAFLKQVVLKSAWRDGWPGVLAGLSAASGALAKHASLIELTMVSEARVVADGPTIRSNGEAGEQPRRQGIKRDRSASGSAEEPGPPLGRTALPALTLDPRTAPASTDAPEPGRNERMTENDQLVVRPEDHWAEPTDASTPEPETAAEPTAAASSDSASGGPTDAAELGPDGEPVKKKRRRRRRRRRGKGEGDAAASADAPADGPVEGSAGGPPRGEDDDAPEPDRTGENAAGVFDGELHPEIFDLERTFKDLGLSEPVIESLDALGFKHPTHIQAALAPVMLAGKDALGQAKTGTGKTAAFGLPLLSMAEKGKPFQALILAPTRELAVQIRQDLERCGKRTGLSVCAVYGGQSIRTQAAALEKGPEIIVGTPGRVMDMVDRGYMHFRKIRFAILDELDRMLDIGFRDDIRKILRACPESRQTVMVSATIAREIESLARQFMTEPEKVQVTGGSLTVELVKQHYITVDPWDKRRLLSHVLTHEEPALTLVFCRMKRTVDKVTEHLNRKGIEAHAIHGDMSQGKRNSVMQHLRKGRLAVLVASDLASRGLDVQGITHVVNYDLPDDPDVYVHRIGRTARIGRDGHAWSFVTPNQGKLLTEIEGLTNVEIPAKKYDDFEASPRPENFRDPDLQPGQRAAEAIVTVPKEKVNRYEPPPPPTKDVVEKNDALAEKFPGGIVPSKKPPKLMRGRARTRRS